MSMHQEQRQQIHEAAFSARSERQLPHHLTTTIDRDVEIDCGWGRLVFGHTFSDTGDLVESLRREKPGHRDLCLYLRDPHVVVGRAPQELFIDPSHTYRLRLHLYRHRRDPIRAVTVRTARSRADLAAINRLYSVCGMVTADEDRLAENIGGPPFVYLLAEDPDGRVIGTVTGIDHADAFNDPEAGTSLWCLAVDPQVGIPGVGEVLVRTLAERFLARGRSYLDLSVMFDNEPAIRLYEKLGFERVPVFCVKRKNPINEPLFAHNSSDDLDRLNVYARIVAEEAARRGIRVEVLDAPTGEIRLVHGGRDIVTRESLSELTSAVAVARCDDKRRTRRLLAERGLNVPRGRDATFDDRDADFLAEVGEVVVKPARGEQGIGVAVGVTDPDELEAALEAARKHCPDVIVEECCAGEDLRIVTIDNEVVAAAVRRPAQVEGTGKHTVEELIALLSRRRAAATDGESVVPIDDRTVATVQASGYELDSVLPEGVRLPVRRTANLHTGGTIHDVTAELHPHLAAIAVEASRAIDIPVAGLDLLVDAPDLPEYVFIEANERPGLANHEPQPTAERFIDLLFPNTRALPRGWEPSVRNRTADHRPEPAGRPE